MVPLAPVRNTLLTCTGVPGTAFTALPALVTEASPLTVLTKPIDSCAQAELPSVPAAISAVKANLVIPFIGVSWGVNGGARQYSEAARINLVPRASFTHSLQIRIYRLAA